ncbi:MAG: V-type ATP synthase subunit D [Woeseiaceae bacterium]
MARRLRVPPTKSKLLELRRHVAFLEAGYELLERKRELLTRLVYERLDQYRELRAKTRTTLEDAYRWLGVTHLRTGSRALEQIVLGLPPALEVDILPRSSLGVEYPSVTAKALQVAPVSLMWADMTLDETRRRLVTLALVLAQLGQAEMALRRLLAEQRKTQKRVNALRYNVIPRYRATLHFIASVLEEEERNTQFQIKVLRESGRL